MCFKAKKKYAKHTVYYQGEVDSDWEELTGEWGYHSGEDIDDFVLTREGRGDITGAKPWSGYYC